MGTYLTLICYPYLVVLPKFVTGAALWPTLLYSIYRAFHRFGQAKFVHCGLVSGSSQLTLLPQLPLKITFNSKVIKIYYHLTLLIEIRDTLCSFKVKIWWKLKMSSFQKGLLSTPKDHSGQRAMRNQTCSDLSKENSVFRSQNFKQKKKALSGG